MSIEPGGSFSYHLVRIAEKYVGNGKTWMAWPVTITKMGRRVYISGSSLNPALSLSCPMLPPAHSQAYKVLDVGICCSTPHMGVVASGKWTHISSPAFP